MGKGNGVYVWRVLIYEKYDWTIDEYRLNRSLVRIFTSKLSAMNYATKMESKKNSYDAYYCAEIEKWFGD